MKIWLPQSKTYKLDIIVVGVVFAAFYYSAEFVFDSILGDQAHLPSSEVNPILIWGPVLVFVIAFFSTIFGSLWLARKIATKYFGVETGMEWVEVDLTEK